MTEDVKVVGMGVSTPMDPRQHIQYLQDQLLKARKDQRRYHMLKACAANGHLMALNHGEFVFVKDLDAFVEEALVPRTLIMGGDNATNPLRAAP